MSRTYRRTKNFNDAYHKMDLRFLVDRYFEVTGHLAPKGKAVQKAKAVFHSDNYRTMTTPMWHYREQVQVPHRRECRDKIKKLTPYNLDELMLTPDKKPQVYYW